MIYQVVVNGKGKAVSIFENAEMENGEVHYSVFDGSAIIGVDAANCNEAIIKAEEIHRRLTKL